MNLWKNFLMWRHSKGFGVHSPYAFRFVNDVLRPGIYKYYSYQEIERLVNESERRNYRFLNLVKFSIRLAVFLNTKRIVTPFDSRLAEITAKSLNLSLVVADKIKGFEFQEGDLILLGPSGSDFSDLPKSQMTNTGYGLDLLQKAIDALIPVFALNPKGEEREILEQPFERGLLLKGKKRIIFIPRQEMAFTCYDILLEIDSNAL